MDSLDGAIVRVIVRAKGPGGVRLAMVELGDGRLGITQDGQLLQTVRFDGADIEGCVREFVRRTQLADEAHPTDSR